MGRSLPGGPSGGVCEGEQPGRGLGPRGWTAARLAADCSQRRGTVHSGRSGAVRRVGSTAISSEPSVRCPPAPRAEAEAKRSQSPAAAALGVWRLRRRRAAGREGLEAAVEHSLRDSTEFSARGARPGWARGWRSPQGAAKRPGQSVRAERRGRGADWGRASMPRRGV